MAYMPLASSDIYCIPWQLLTKCQGSPEVTYMLLSKNSHRLPVCLDADHKENTAAHISEFTPMVCDLKVAIFASI